MIPLSIMFLCAIFTMLAYSFVNVYTENNLTESGEIRINESGEEKTSKVEWAEKSEAQSIQLTLSSPSTIFAIVIAGLAVGITAGVRALGSGLSSFSQRIILVLAIYGGIYTILSIVAAGFFNSTVIGMVTWFGISLMFVFGIVTTVLTVIEEE